MRIPTAHVTWATCQIGKGKVNSPDFVVRVPWLSRRMPVYYSLRH